MGRWTARTAGGQALRQLLAAGIFLVAAGCNGGGGTADVDVEEDADTVEIPEEFTFAIELVPAVGYEPGLDLSTITVTIHADPPIVFESIDVPDAGPFIFTFEMEPQQAAVVAGVTVDGYRSELEGTIFSTGRCPPVRLGDYAVDPETGLPHALRLFFHRLEEFSLMPDTLAMTVGRFGHRAAATPGGRIVIVGGATPTGLTRVIEVMDPGPLTFGPIGELPEPRSEFTLLSTGEGEWLIVGGRTAQTGALRMRDDGTTISFETVEVPTELQGVWANPRATMLAGGSWVLGGADTGPDTPSAVYAVYDPAAGFSVLSFMAGPDPIEMDKYHPTLTTVATAAGERVLVYGGAGTLIPAILLDPATGELSDGGQTLVDGRYDHGAGSALMHSDDGTVENQAVLILAGEEKPDGVTPEPAETVQVFIPACLDGPCIMPSAWSNAGPAFADRPAKAGSVAILPDGRILYIGGRGSDGEAVGTVIAFTASTPTRFYPTNFTLAEPRVGAETVWYEPTGQLFILGGEGTGGVPLGSVEVFTPREPEE
jgi:hypothetical protein